MTMLQHLWRFLLAAAKEVPSSLVLDAVRT